MMDATNLLLPTFLHGPYAEVKRACRKAAGRVAKGASLASLPEHWFDAAELTGRSSYILTEGPKASTSGEPHYQGYALIAELLRAFDGKIGDPRWEAVFEEMLTRPWLIYCCLGQDSYHLFASTERARRFAVAVRDQWAALNLPGRRFLGGWPVGFWAAQHTVGYCLGRLGASNQDLMNDARAAIDPTCQDGAMSPVLDRYAR